MFARYRSAISEARRPCTVLSGWCHGKKLCFFILASIDILQKSLVVSHLLPYRESISVRLGNKAIALGCGIVVQLRDGQMTIMRTGEREKKTARMQHLNSNAIEVFFCYDQLSHSQPSY